MKLHLTTDRKVVKIEGPDFSLTLNGKTNAEYGQILTALGVDIVWVEPTKEIVAPLANERMIGERPKDQ